MFLIRNMPIRGKMKSPASPAPMWVKEWDEMGQFPNWITSGTCWSEGHSWKHRGIKKMLKPKITNTIKNFFFLVIISIDFFQIL